VFQRLVTADGTRAIVDVADIEDLASDPKEIRRIVDHLTAARLLVVQTRSEEEGPAIELVHESLISSWPTLRRWLDESQEDAAFLEQLRTVAKQWDKSGRPQGLLWRGEAMEEAQRFDRRYKGNLSKREREYLDAVLNLATRSARIRKIATMGTIAFLIALVIGAAIALVLIRNAEKDAKKQASLAKTEAKRALAAEQKAKREFERYKEAQQGRVQAEKAATKAKTEVATKKKELKSTQSKYNMTRQQLEEALTRAEAEKKRAKKASAAARTAAEKAQLAEAKARKLAEKEQKAAKKLKKLLTREKARVRKLIKERNKIATSLK
jgi:pyruvate/2-oxoglutarate dehydrogenase complex dihydrolipoamide acyltransferase (E2) component